MKTVKFSAKPKSFSASAPVKKFADTSFDFGANVSKKKGGGKKKSNAAGGGS